MFINLSSIVLPLKIPGLKSGYNVSEQFSYNKIIINMIMMLIRLSWHEEGNALVQDLIKKEKETAKKCDKVTVQCELRSSM